MKKQVSIALAAGLLLAGATAASAAGISSSSSPKMSNPAAQDSLSLATSQQKTAWNDLKGQASNQTAPSGFQATIGSVVPSNLKIAPVPSKTATEVPALKPYDFAMVSGKLLIVNPSDKKVVEVITG